MKLKEINVQYQRVLNLGEYSSVRVTMDVSVVAEEGDDPANVAMAARTMAKNNVMAEIACYEDRLKAVVEDLYMGLPIQESE